MAEDNARPRIKKATNLSQAITINVMTTMNVEAIIAAHPTLSQNPDSPTAIGHEYIYMSSDDPRGWSAPDPGNINLNAHVKDTLSFYCGSVSANSDTAAFIYRLTGGTPVLNPSHVDVFTLQKAAEPTPPNGYPFKYSPRNFSACDAVVSQQGTARNFWVSVALFTLDDTGENQVLRGYVSWDPTVNVA